MNRETERNHWHTPKRRSHIKKYLAIPVIAFLALAVPGRADTIFVANFSGNNIEKFTPAGVGSLFSTTGNGPGGLAFDASGNLYVSYELSSAIDKITPGGHVHFLSILASTRFSV